MRLYHSTTPEAATAIRERGFRNTEGAFLTPKTHSGVWLSNTPLDENEGAKGADLLVVEMPEERVSQYEWIEEGKPYREFLVPADLVNQFGPPGLVDRLTERERASTHENAQRKDRTDHPSYI